MSFIYSINTNSLRSPGEELFKCVSSQHQELCWFCLFSSSKLDEINPEYFKLKMLCHRSQVGAMFKQWVQHDLLNKVHWAGLIHHVNLYIEIYKLHWLVYITCLSTLIKMHFNWISFANLVWREVFSLQKKTGLHLANVYEINVLSKFMNKNLFKSAETFNKNVFVFLK